MGVGSKHVVSKTSNLFSYHAKLQFCWRKKSSQNRIPDTDLSGLPAWIRWFFMGGSGWRWGGWFKSYPQGQPTPFQRSKNNIYKLLYTQPKFDKTKNPTWKSLFGWKMPLNLWNVWFNSRVSNYSKWLHTTKPTFYKPQLQKKTTRHQNAQNQHLLEVQHSSQNIGGTFAHPERKH